MPTWHMLRDMWNKWAKLEELNQDGDNRFLEQYIRCKLGTTVRKG